MNLKQALLHNTGWKVITMLFTFINNIIIVRMLGVVLSSNFFYSIAIFSFIGTVLSFGLGNGIIYFNSYFPKKTKFLAVFLAIVISIQTLITFFIVKYFLKEAITYSLVWMTFFIMSNVLGFYVTALFQVKKMFISINFSGTVITFLQTFFFIILFYSTRNVLVNSHLAMNQNDSLLAIMGACVLLQMVFLCIYFYLENKDDFHEINYEPGLIIKIFKFSFINFLASVLLFMVMRVDFYFVNKFCDAHTLGNYVQIVKIGQMALVFPGLLGGVIFPYSVNASEKFSEKIGFFCRLITVLFLILLIGLGIFGAFIFIWLLGPSYNLMFSGILGTLPGVYCLSISIILISFFEGKNKQGIILSSSILTLFIIITGDYFFVPIYGYMAAAIIFSIANLAGLYLLTHYFFKKTGIKKSRLFLFSFNDLTSFKLTK